MTDLEQTMGAILGDGLAAMSEAAGFSRDGVTVDLTAMVERAEKHADELAERSNLLKFTYRCGECGEKLDPNTDLIFRRDKHVGYYRCRFHAGPEDNAMFCAVAGCNEPTLGTLCQEHQTMYALGEIELP